MNRCLASLNVEFLAKRDCNVIIWPLEALSPGPVARRFVGKAAKKNSALKGDNYCLKNNKFKK